MAGKNGIDAVIAGPFSIDLRVIESRFLSFGPETRRIAILPIKGSRADVRHASVMRFTGGYNGCTVCRRRFCGSSGVDFCQTQNKTGSNEFFSKRWNCLQSVRREFLDSQCGADTELRRAVDALVEEGDASVGGAFLESVFMADRELLSLSEISKSNAAAFRPPDIATASENTRFQILSKHQQGGLGEVFIAYDRQLKREVAIKQIRPKWSSHQEARQRFIREAEVTGRLEHPGIVPVYAIGTWDDGSDYYAMRFIHGQTLQAVIQDYHDATKDGGKRANMLVFRGLLNRFVDVCNTISYAHSREILHRDIKPSNIMVGPYGETLVVDWGLAKLLDEPLDESLTASFDAKISVGTTLTAKGPTVGTPQYMSPEQACGQLDEIGIRTDVYLLGATLYHILTGQPPHIEKSFSILIGRIQDGIVTPPTEIEPKIPQPLSAICMTAMAVAKEDRYRSVAELAADVERWLADAPVSVFQDSVLIRLGRWFRHHQTLLAVASVALLLVVVSSVLGTLVWSYQQTR